MPKTQHLIRRRQTWYVRLRVPADLLELYKPKKEIQRSLKTRDYKDALKRLSPAKSEIEAEFEMHRKRLDAGNDNSDVLSAYSDHDLIQLTRKWFSDIRTTQEQRRMKDHGKWTEERKRDYYSELRQEELDAREEALGLSDQERHEGLTTAVRFLETEGLSYRRGSENFQKLGFFFSKAIHELAQQNLKEFEGKLPIGGAVSSMPGTASLAPVKVLSMRALFDEYLADPSRKREASTLKNYAIVRRAIDEVIGNDKPVHKITREDCKELRNFLLLLPSNAIKKTQAKTLKESIKIAEALKWLYPL